MRASVIIPDQASEAAPEPLSGPEPSLLADHSLPRLTKRRVYSASDKPDGDSTPSSLSTEQRQNGCLSEDFRRGRNRVRIGGSEHTAEG